uniref:Prepilin leader peptidase/N-methyltransferase n=1 Tax=Candidatus Nitrotoga fabula TaxID=2182327 RepID=A0A2X0SIV3_9PROT|nr:Type 4 prepilin-like proteins leader peptide-processing enzyme [Includes: Leader peptidase; N-methyltransferase] [Candidatus Nitrotoga fabula]
MAELTETLQTFPILFIALCGITGLLAGSFLNVVIHRLPKMLEQEWLVQHHEYSGKKTDYLSPYNLLVPPSSCPHCNHKIRALENIPVISYLFLRGKCKHCGTPISTRYPAVEMLSGLLCTYAAWHFGVSLATLGAMIFIWMLLVLSCIDLNTQMLPDEITLPLLWLGLLFNLFGTFIDLSSAVIGAITGYLILWGIYWLFRLVSGKEGLGYGDFKFLAALGAWLGWQSIPVIILLASITGIISSIALITTARLSRNDPIPFGPFLALSGLIALFWGQTLTPAYMKLLLTP